MWFERTSCVIGQRVKSEHDCFGLLQGCVEGIAEVHEECIAVPPEAVLNVRIGEPCAVEEPLLESSGRTMISGPGVQVVC